GGIISRLTLTIHLPRGSANPAPTPRPYLTYFTPPPPHVQIARSESSNKHAAVAPGPAGPPHRAACLNRNQPQVRRPESHPGHDPKRSSPLRAGASAAVGFAATPALETH